MNQSRSPRRMVVAFAILFSGVILVNAAVAQEETPVLGQQTVMFSDLRPLSLSPDGRFIAAANRDELCIYQVPSIAEQVCVDLTPLDAGLRLADVAWSPDSTRLVLTEDSFRLLRDGDLWIVDAMSGELTNLTDDGYNGNLPLLGASEKLAGVTLYFDVAPAWSPDSQFITFSRTTFVDGESAGNDIVTIPATGGDPEVLMNATPQVPGSVYFPMRWSPDGNDLYFSLIPVQQRDPLTGIYRYNAATGNAERLLGFSPELGAPAIVEISPAADKLLVFYPSAAVNFGTMGPIFWLLDVDSLGLEPLYPPGAAEDGIEYASVATFSPDGESILIATARTEPDHQLWEVAIDTGEATQLVESLSGAIVIEFTIAPSWTASGRIFVVAGPDSGTLLEVAPRKKPVFPNLSDLLDNQTPVASDEFAAGDEVIVVTNGVPLFAAPSPTAQAVMLLGEGDHVTVIGSPEEVDGEVWLPVQDAETRTIGFVRVEQVEKT